MAGGATPLVSSLSALNSFFCIVARTTLTVKKRALRVLDAQATGKPEKRVLQNLNACFFGSCSTFHLLLAYGGLEAGGLQSPNGFTTFAVSQWLRRNY